MTAPTATPPLAAVEFIVPPLNPAPGGLVAATSWTEETTGANRWLASGIQFRGAPVGNYDGGRSSGVWNVPWCETDPEDIKDGARPDDLAAWEPVTAWGFDSCDLTAPSRAEVTDRAQQVLRLAEPGYIAREFAGRVKAEAGTPETADSLVDALGSIEDSFAALNVVGYVHVAPRLLPALVSGLLVSRTGTGLRTPAGHSVIVDGGYREVLGDGTLLATSAPFGWRNTVTVTTTTDPEAGLFIALAERSSVVGVEAIIGAVKVTS